MSNPVAHGVSAGIGHAIPVLRVANFEDSVRYYTEALGFSLQWQEGKFGCVYRDSGSIFLSEGSQGCSATWMWLSARDVDDLYTELKSRGAKIRVPPTNYPWGSRELHVFDIDGHVLRFGSDLRPDEPMGTWLGEDGSKWLAAADGSWTKQDA